MSAAIRALCVVYAAGALLGSIAIDKVKAKQSKAMSASKHSRHGLRASIDAHESHVPPCWRGLCAGDAV
jgi:hypothetical protein